MQYFLFTASVHQLIVRSYAWPQPHLCYHKLYSNIIVLFLIIFLSSRSWNFLPSACEPLYLLRILSGRKIKCMQRFYAARCRRKFYGRGHPALEGWRNKIKLENKYWADAAKRKHAIKLEFIIKKRNASCCNNINW